MSFVHLERDRDTALLSFARPPLNALNLELIEELQLGLSELADDLPRAGLVLTGDGDAFSAGVDFKEVPRYSRAERMRMVLGINAVVTSLYTLPVATVAAVNGHAIGGGLVMALACDFRLAAERRCSLGLTEVTAGLPYPACAMELLHAEIEPAWRRRLVLSGDRFEPGIAHARGLIDALVAPAKLREQAVELARQRAAAASYALVKEQLKRGPAERMRQKVASGWDPLLDLSA